MSRKFFHLWKSHFLANPLIVLTWYCYCRFLKLLPKHVWFWQLKPFFVNFGDGNWRQGEAWIVLLAGAIEVNALAQEALRQFTQWLWIEHPTFQLGGGHLLPLSYCRPIETFLRMIWFIIAGFSVNVEEAVAIHKYEVVLKDTHFLSEQFPQWQWCNIPSSHCTPELVSTELTLVNFNWLHFQFDRIFLLNSDDAVDRGSPGVSTGIWRKIWETAKHHAASSISSKLVSVTTSALHLLACLMKRNVDAKGSILHNSASLTLHSLWPTMAASGNLSE